MDLDPDHLRAYARRDWGLPERLALRTLPDAPVAAKVRAGIALYEAARRTRPDWPDAATRADDLRALLRLKRLLDQAGDVRPR